MDNALLSAVSRHADAHADSDGIAATAIEGLTVLRAVSRSELQYAISKPLVAMVVQGNKRVMMGREAFDFGAGDAMVIAADVPTVSQITKADARAPYYSLVVELVPTVIEALTLEMDIAQAEDFRPIRVEPTESEVADAALRLMRLLERPSAALILQTNLIRELHYWLMAGRHGPAIRRLGIAAGHTQRIASAVAVIRTDYVQPLRVERLAEAAGMSASSFHQHFRAATSLSPLQFQKQLRLIEARRLMLAKGTPASQAAHAVGYESVPQFTREYGRMFGSSPMRDIRAARSRAVPIQQAG
jgi:AraC-like DNA-binding protein